MMRLHLILKDPITLVLHGFIVLRQLLHLVVLLLLGLNFPTISNGSWDRIWKHTTRFIVDSYHYINHRVGDYICRKWCNPAPLNGSAPNLVVVEKDKHGRSYYKRAFNTQACEQLNAWLGGFESILKRMTQGNFDWFLHSMLFYHSQYVMEKQMKRPYMEEEKDVDSDFEDDT
ncbi:uncharacterized protein LACBIDRAFT_304273 [Laccaria bicolor S238N-H82]|uniref:Predicted protein n=1 Tax=Laccaria bicolor (strain S238N-H82 / ATCC MYA-4686) TaxID=486041 RepID=B0DL97_LACBS|nr:uncharacterized protein LACBIDRAFT_304273 [Laccaria bicolor S238N-H82]EDR04613.1 predicted protein [Laccaria bicolor S238N-H82]|eukprot:XP_001884785.1 predicted protein [Laccaria bicolor S238N-H82]